MAAGSHHAIVPSRLATEVILSHSGATHGPRTKVGAFIALTKPRIIELLLVTTIPTMILAQEGLPYVGLRAAPLGGGAHGWSPRG